MSRYRSRRDAGLCARCGSVRSDAALCPDCAAKRRLDRSVTQATAAHRFYCDLDPAVYMRICVTHGLRPTFVIRRVRRLQEGQPHDAYVNEPLAHRLDAYVRRRAEDAADPYGIAGVPAHIVINSHGPFYAVGGSIPLFPCTVA